MNVSEVMTTDVKTVERNDVMSLAEDLMEMGRIRHLPVLDEDRVVGVVSQRDLFRAAMSSAMGYGQKASHEFLGTVAVKEVMSDELTTVSPGDSVARAAALMLEHKIGCLPVVDDGKLVGLVTESDLLRLIAER